MTLKPLPILSALALLAGCEAKIRKDAGQGNTASPADQAQVSAEGKSEAGQFSVKAPGLDLKLDIPDALQKRASMDSDSEILYPGATLAGMHVEAGSEKSGRNESAVELRFTTNDAPAKVAGWYRDPARKGGFAVTSARQQGASYVIAGTEKGDGDPFTVHLDAASGGGTEGRLILRDQG